MYKLSPLIQRSRIIKNHDYCKVKMPEACNKILQFNQDKKYMKIRFAIYTGIEAGIGSLVEVKINTG